MQKPSPDLINYRKYMTPSSRLKPQEGFQMFKGLRHLQTLVLEVLEKKPGKITNTVIPNMLKNDI